MLATPEVEGDKGVLGARLHYARWGHAGTRVLLIHAIGFDHHSWDDVAPHLARDYQLAAVDLPGHGESDKPAGGDYSLATLGKRVLCFLDELGWEDAVLVGNSIGGGTALSATLQAPDRVRGLALVNSVGFRPGLPVVGRLGAVPLLPRFAGYVPPALMRLGLDYARCGWGGVSPNRVQSCSTLFRNPEGAAAFFRTLRSLYGRDLDRMAAHYREIRCPTRVIHGEKDPLIRLSHAERLAQEIPPAELVRMPGCGHFPPEECPDRLAEELDRFLRRLKDG